LCAVALADLLLLRQSKGNGTAKIWIASAGLGLVLSCMSAEAAESGSRIPLSRAEILKSGGLSKGDQKTAHFVKLRASWHSIVFLVFDLLARQAELEYTTPWLEGEWSDLEHLCIHRRSDEFKVGIRS
jgi:hypothetical protein